MKLTRKQRNEAYRWAYFQIGEDDPLLHICGVLTTFQELRYGVYNLYSNMPIIFPEFGMFKPEVMPFDGTHWFEYNEKGRAERLTCLAFCIAMTE